MSAAAESSGTKRRTSARLGPQAPSTPGRVVAVTRGNGARRSTRESDKDDDDVESEESEIDLSPLPAERRASLVARLSASPIKSRGGDDRRMDEVMPVLESDDEPERDVPTIKGTDGEDSDSDDDDGAPVEESMTQARSKVFAAREKVADARKQETLKRKHAAEVQAQRRAANPAAPARANAEAATNGTRDESTADADEDDSEDGADGVEEDLVTVPPTVKGNGAQILSTTIQDDNPAPAKKGRLDPALFAEAFGKTAKAGRGSSSSSSQSGASRLTRLGASQLKRPTRSSASKQGGLVKGRDCLPMKRLDDGRTVVRSLQQKAKRPSISRSDEPDEDAETLETPDTNLAGPNAKARAFTKKRLGLRAADIALASGAAGSKDKKKEKKTKPERTEDDPLGLEDPLFMNLDSKKNKRESTLTGRRPRGAERGASGSASASRSGPRGEGGRQPAKATAFGGRGAAPAILFRRS
ncbi:unnamed protein product [Tilletia laevis]|uniref:DNA replication regulator SLD2 n=3 Tax=Tilletia TaxID=13289 RepID=A0ABN7IX61_9BASI|nr:hypothetical protein CF335_g4684 [Tilletia laevis]CAD6885764.1 unnamed protein product [Tilletia caries]CAD6903177.1 unnamed protein product [Tilletia laevis]CAD6923430.1 unnamed protein product [Tilletia caries]CAD7061130.1 unnamed protein product [Tilletia caries]